MFPVGQVMEDGIYCRIFYDKKLVCVYDMFQRPEVLVGERRSSRVKCNRRASRRASRRPFSTPENGVEKGHISVMYNIRFRLTSI